VILTTEADITINLFDEWICFPQDTNDIQQASDRNIFLVDIWQSVYFATQARLRQLHDDDTKSACQVRRIATIANECILEQNTRRLQSKESRFARKNKIQNSHRRTRNKIRAVKASARIRRNKGAGGGIPTGRRRGKQIHNT
jgi:hypothetical protein